MIDKKKLTNVLNNKEEQTKKPLDPKLTPDVKNGEVEAQIKVYLQEKTGENLNRLIELIRTRRILVPANADDKNKPLPCLIESPENTKYLPIYTSREHVPREPKSTGLVNMPYLMANQMVAAQKESVEGIVLNPFTDNLVFKRPLIEKIEEVEKVRKSGVQQKTMQLTPEQYVLFERKQFEFGHIPKRFFEQGKAMLDELCEKKEIYIDEFFEESYQQKRMYPYLPEDFSVMVMDISEELLVVRVDLPNRDMGIPSCYRVYFSWNSSTDTGRYFTIERTQDAGVHLLGEFGRDWKHIDHGAAPAEGAELQRVLDLIQEQNIGT